MSQAGRADRYKWTVPVNTTIGTLMPDATGRNNEMTLNDLAAGSCPGRATSCGASMSGPDVEAVLAWNPELMTEEDA